MLENIVFYKKIKIIIIFLLHFSGNIIYKQKDVCASEGRKAYNANDPTLKETNNTNLPDE